MKRIFYPIFALLISFGALAQAPQMFNYQAVIRDDGGNPLVSEAVEVSIAILEGSAEGTEVFSETHQITTNEFGIVNLQVGSESSMENIDWSADLYFVQVSLDGNIMGTSPLLSVPFALHAATSANAFSGDYHDLEGAPELDDFISIESPQEGDMIYYDEGGWQTLSLGEEGQILTIVDGKPAWADFEPGDNGNDNTVTDIDGNVYPTVEIGNQEWMAKNLRVTSYRNGTPIPGDLNDNDWENTEDGAYAVQPHDNVEGIDSEEEMVSAYGKLYNCYAVTDEQGLCPEGWRVPTDDDWFELSTFITNDGHPGSEGNALKSCRQVNSPLGGDCDTDEHPRWSSNDNHYGTDDYGFNAPPGGFRRDDGLFLGIGNNGYWWTSTESTEFAGNGWYRALRNYQGTLARGDFNKSTGFLVRCVKE